MYQIERANRQYAYKASSNLEPSINLFNHFNA